MIDVIEKYKEALIHRYDDNGYVKYFSASDFEGLCTKGFTFRSCGNLLKGYFYYYENNSKAQLIVFCHGLGGGHRAYMREIETLCREGYVVFSYDNTGCFESEGEDIHCVSQITKDLESAMIAIKAQEELTRFKNVYLIAHSWAGIAAYGIQNHIECFDKIVVISGVAYVRNMSEVFVAHTTEEEKIDFERVIDYEKNALPEYFECNAVENVNTKRAQFFIAHSKEDTLVLFEKNFEYIRKNVTRKDVVYCVYEGKQHNPNYEKDAVDYMRAIFGTFGVEKAKGNLATLEEKQNYFKDVDWKRMTAQDMDFWHKVFDFLR